MIVLEHVVMVDAVTEHDNNRTEQRNKHNPYIFTYLRTDRQELMHHMLIANPEKLAQVMKKSCLRYPYMLQPQVVHIPTPVCSFLRGLYQYDGYVRCKMPPV